VPWDQFVSGSEIIAQCCEYEVKFTDRVLQWNGCTADKKVPSSCRSSGVEYVCFSRDVPFVARRCETRMPRVFFPNLVLFGDIWKIPSALFASGERTTIFMRSKELNAIVGNVSFVIR